MAEFRELRGDYVEHEGQQINLRGYLDYFEPLGSSLSRLPDGAGGPFVYRFVHGERTIGALGWVVSASSRRYGAWKLWGLWTERSMPPIALPLFWPELADPSRVGGVVDRANRDATRLLDRRQWPALCDQIAGARLRNAAFRELLKAELSYAYAVPLPHRQPIEIDLTADMLDLLPWLYLLGPVDPAEAQLQPSRFNGGGYQYILTERQAPRRDAEIPAEVDEIVDAAAEDVSSGWKKAHNVRTRRARPAPKPAHAPRREPRRWEEEDEMPSRKPPAPEPALPLEKWIPIWTAIFQIAVLALLVWIALEVRGIRKAGVPNTSETTTTAVDDNPAPVPAPAPVPSPAEEPESPATRVTRITQKLATTPPQGIRVNRAAIVDSASLARAAIEVSLRSNGCVPRAEVVDGKLSAAEQRAMRTCGALRNERLVNGRGDIDEARAIAWLERMVP